MRSSTRKSTAIVAGGIIQDEIAYFRAYFVPLEDLYSSLRNIGARVGSAELWEAERESLDTVYAIVEVCHYSQKGEAVRRGPEVERDVYKAWSSM